MWFVGLALAFGSCSGSPLPDHYGVFALTEKGLVELSAQQQRMVGSVFQGVAGIPGPSGAEFSRVDLLIVFERGGGPEGIRLSELTFTGETQIPNPFGSQQVRVNLWTPAKLVNLEISPVKGHPEMWRLKPKQTLGNGFYALHSGGLGEVITGELIGAAGVYDFVVGHKEDYPSHSVRAKQTTETMSGEAGRLLKALNEIFNRRDFARLDEVYRPSGRILRDNERAEFVQGVETWLASAGTIRQSRITNQHISEDGHGLFDIETTYEKVPSQKEQIQVSRLGDQYFITLLE